MTHKTILTSLFIIVAALALWRLDEPTFWNDESHIFLGGLQMLQSGHSDSWDGRNLCNTDRNGGYIDNNYRNVMPQLDFIVSAIPGYIFGPYVWSARICFAIAGLLAILLLLYWTKLELNNKILQIYTLCTIGFSATFLLYIRTCRYYALGALLITVCLIAYNKFFKSKHWKWLGLFTIASVFLYYASALVCGAFFIALGTRTLLFYRSKITKQDIKRLVICGITFIVSIMPYVLTCTLPYIQLAKEDVSTSNIDISWIETHSTLLWWYIEAINYTAVLPWTLLLALTYVYHKYMKPKEQIICIEWITIICGYVIGIALLSPQPVQLTSIADIRYLAPIQPIFAALIGLLLFVVHKHYKWISIAILSILLSSTILSVCPSKWNFRWLLPAYVHEITNPYPTACSSASLYLRQNAKQDDTVYITPEYMQGPMQFEIGNIIKIRGVLNYKTRLNISDIKSFDPLLFIENVYPDWIVACGVQPDLEETINKFSRVHDNISYKYELVAKLPVYWNEIQRPELPWHSFGPKQDFNIDIEAVYIFKRK